MGGEIKSRERRKVERKREKEPTIFMIHAMVSTSVDLKSMVHEAPFIF